VCIVPGCDRPSIQQQVPARNFRGQPRDDFGKFFLFFSKEFFVLIKGRGEYSNAFVGLSRVNGTKFSWILKIRKGGGGERER